MRSLLLMLLLSVVAGQACPKEVPVEDFARRPKFTDAKISPTGEYLAVSVPQDDQTGLVIIRLADMKITGGARGGLRTHVADFWWVNPNRIVVALANQYGALDRLHLNGELMGVNADGSGLLHLYGYLGGKGSGKLRQGTQESGYAELVSTLPHDPNNVLIAVRHYDDDWSRNSAIAFLMDVMSGKTQWAARAPLPGPIAFVADEKGEVRYAVGQDEDTLADHTFVRNPTTDQWTEIGKPTIERSIIPLRITSDGTTVYQHARDGTDAYCLSAQDLASGISQKLACHAVADLAWVYFSADRNVPLAAVFEPGKPELAWVNKNHPDAKVLALLATGFPGQEVVPTSWSDDGSELVFLVYGDKNPGEFFLYDRKTGKAQFLVARYEWINPKDMAEVRPISFKSRDGATVHGFLTLPPGRPLTKLPLVVHPHGGPFGVRDSWGWDTDPQLLANRGYAVLQINFRGSGGYGLKHLESARQSWGTLMIDDITDAVRWTLAEGIADPGRICIYGASYGGYAALMSAVREPDLYQCVIGYVGVYDLEAMISDTDIGRTQMGRNFMDMYLGADSKILAEQSPINHLDQLKAPVFIIHGESDLRAPFNQAKLLRKALKKRNHPYEWLTRVNEGHGFYKEEHRIDLYNKLLDFLDRHIGAKKTVTAPVTE